MRAQPSGTVKWTVEFGATWSTKTALSGMSPGGLNSVGCAELGAEGGLLGDLPGLAECVVAVDGAELEVLGADEGPLEELHPARAPVDSATTLAMVAADATSADRGVVM